MMSPRALISSAKYGTRVPSSKPGLEAVCQLFASASSVGLKALLRKMEHKAERDAQHHGQQGHEDAHKLNAELPDHTSATSR